MNERRKKFALRAKRVRGLNGAAVRQVHARVRRDAHERQPVWVPMQDWGVLMRPFDPVQGKGEGWGAVPWRVGPLEPVGQGEAGSMRRQQQQQPCDGAATEVIAVAVAETHACCKVGGP